MSRALNFLEQLRSESPTIFFRCAPQDGWPIIQISPNIEMFGFDRDELIKNKLTFKDIIHPDDFDRVELEAYTAIKSGQEEIEVEYRILSPQGRIYWVRDKSIIERDRWNRIKLYHGMLFDITDSVNQKSELQLVKNLTTQYQQMLDQVAMVAITDRRGKITFANDQFCEVSGYSREELMGNTHKIVNSGMHTKEFFKDLWATVSRGKIWRGQIVNRAKNGELKWMQTAIVPFFENGQVSHYMGVRFDITNQKNLEKSLKEEKEFNALSAHLATIGEMSTGIMHEINNPLTVVSCHVDYLLKSAKRGSLTGEGLLDGLQKIKRATDRAGKVTKSLRSLSQFHFDEDMKKVCLTDIVKESIDLCTFKLKKADTEVLVENNLSDDYIESRDTEISQILINLINNSCDAVISLKERWVKIILEEDIDKVRILVQDSGKGIPDDIADKIMEAFYTTKERGKGTGVGLSLCNYLANSVNGILFLDRRADNTTFVLELNR